MSYHHIKRELKQETVQDPHYEALKRKKEMELLLSQRPVLPNQYWNTNNIKQVNYTPTMGGAALKCEVKMEFSTIFLNLNEINIPGAAHYHKQVNIIAYRWKDIIFTKYHVIELPKVG